MLIRAITTDDIPVWLALAHESDDIVSELIPDISTFYDGFDDYMQAKIRQNEAFMAVDSESERCLGIVAFSKTNNRITYLGVTENADFQHVGPELLELAINQLDNNKDISVNVLKSDSGEILKEYNLYENFGFLEVNDSVIEAGVPARLMTKPPVDKDKAGIVD